MGCEMSDKIKGILGQCGKPVSSSYAHKMADLTTALITFASKDLDDATRFSMARKMEELLDENPPMMGDLEDLKKEFPAAMKGLMAYLNRDWDKSSEGWGISTIGQEGYFGYEELQEANLYYGDEEEAWNEPAVLDEDYQPSDEQLGEVAEQFGARKGYAVACRTFDVFTASYSANRAFYATAVEAAKSIATHFHPASGDGKIKDYVKENVAQLKASLAAFPSTPGQWDKTAFVAHYQAVVDDLEACIASAEKGESEWRKPKQVIPFPDKQYLSAIKTAHVLPPNEEILKGAAKGDARYGGFMRGYEKGLNQGFRELLYMAVPASGADKKIRDLAVVAAKSLAAHAQDGNMSLSGKDALEGAKKAYAATKEDASLFPTPDMREKFIQHYEAVFADLDACAAVLPEKTGKKPKKVAGYLETEYHPIFIS